MPSLENGLRRARQRSGLKQGELASRAGISRQTLSALEAGRAQPSTAIALNLARALGCRMEELFWRPDDPFALLAPADALLTRGGLYLLRPRESVEANLLVIGCDPGLAVLAGRFADRWPGQRLCWVGASSDAALTALARGHAHVAGAHLFDEQAREFNVPFVRRTLAGRAMVVVTFAHLEEGFALAPGNPRHIKRPEDIARPGVRFVNREPGAGARRLLDRLLRKARVPASAVKGYDRLLGGHLQVAQAVAMGTADAGVVARSAAVAYGLDFVPLSEERFDLVFPKEWSTDPRAARMVETLEGRAFRRELGSLGGYDTRQSGHLVTELP